MNCVDELFEPHTVGKSVHLKKIRGTPEASGSSLLGPIRGWPNVSCTRLMPFVSRGPILTRR
jgi:hypothetical protein